MHASLVLESLGWGKTMVKTTRIFGQLTARPADAAELRALAESNPALLSADDLRAFLGEDQRAEFDNIAKRITRDRNRQLRRETKD